MTRDDTGSSGRAFDRPGSPGDRGVSFTLGYVLTVAIALVLVTGVLFTVGEVVRDERDEVIRGEAAVVGDQTAAAVMAVDRLAGRDAGSNATVSLDLPDRLADQAYTVSLRTDGGDTFVVVRTRSPSVVVSTPLRTRLPVTEATVAGSRVRAVYRGADGTLTLRGGER
ncbi:MAG: hypothetical protein V5A60_05880 [Haloarculaceae archaeon]